MCADAFQEDGFAVEQKLLAARLDGAEADFIANHAFAQTNLHLIEFWRGGAPEFGLGLEFDADGAVGRGDEGFLHLQFGDAERHFVSALGLVEFGAEGQQLGVAACASQFIVLDVDRCYVDEQDVARDAAVVPPVEDTGGHGLGLAFVIDHDDDGVLAIMNLVGHVHVERREAAHVVPYLSAVQPNTSLVVHGAEVEDGAAVGLLLIVETAHQPHRTFVEEQLVVLRVPVARHLHDGRGVEVVLDEIFGTCGLGVAEEPPACRVHSVIVVAFFLHIDDVMPRPVQGQGIAAQDVGHLRHFGCRS